MSKMKDLVISVSEDFKAGYSVAELSRYYGMSIDGIIDCLKVMGVYFDDTEYVLYNCHLFE